MALNVKQTRFLQPLRSNTVHSNYTAAIEDIAAIKEELKKSEHSDGISVVARYTETVNDVTKIKSVLGIFANTGYGDPEFTYFVLDSDKMEKVLSDIATLNGDVNTSGSVIKIVTDAINNLKTELVDNATDYNTIGKLETQVKELESLVGSENVSTQITNVVNELDSSVTSVDGLYVNITVEQTDGELSSASINENGLKEKFSSIEKAIESAETAAKAAATTIEKGTDDGNNLSITSISDETTGSLTYTIGLTDIASAAALDAEEKRAVAAEEALGKRIDTEANDRIAQDNKIEAAIGLTEDGSYTQRTDSNYINNATTVVGAIDALDTQAKVNADAIDALEEKMGSDSVQTQITEAINGLDVTQIGVDGSYIQMVSETDGKISATAKQLVATSDKVLTYNENGITSTIEVKKLTEAEITALGNANVAEAYKLIGKDSTQLGDTILIYKDQALKDVKLDGQNLVFTYTLADGTDKTLTVDVSSFLSESEYGNGLKVVDHVISAKLGEDTASNKNFLDLEGDVEGEKSLVVRSMDTDVTVTTDRILVAGGPLDSTALRGILPKDDSGNAYIEKGTDLQELLLSLFTKVEWPTPTVTEGKINTTIANPTVSLNISGTVEVGTVATLSEATLSQVVNKTTARTISEFTYGYSTTVDGTINKGKSISIAATNVGVNGDNYTMTRDFTGFANTDDSATPSTTASDVKLASVQCTVVEGLNSVKISVKGPKGTCQFVEAPQYYVASNIGTLAADHMSPSKAIATVTEDTTPSSSKTVTVNGAYKYFLGYSTNTSYDQFDSASVRALTTKSGWITKDNTTTIVGAEAITSNGNSIVIACPSKYKLATITNGVGANILANFSSVGEVDVTTGSITTKYKVYVYPITNGATVEFKGVTLN